MVKTTGYLHLLMIIDFCFTLQRKNEFLQRSSKLDDKEIEKQRVTNKLTSQGKEGLLADRVQPLSML